MNPYFDVPGFAEASAHYDDAHPDDAIALRVPAYGFNEDFGDDEDEDEDEEEGEE